MQDLPIRLERVTKISKAHQQNVVKISPFDFEEETDPIAIEEPLEIRLAYWDRSKMITKSIAVTMRTPGLDELLTIGFLKSEGIIKTMDDIESLSHCPTTTKDQSPKNIFKIVLKNKMTPELGFLDRHFTINSACGLCGKKTLDALTSQAPMKKIVATFTINPEFIMSLPSELHFKQALHRQTGGMHATGLFNLDGPCLGVFEDIGRHNAFDKMLGFMVKNGAHFGSPVIAVVSGRASFELVQKAIIGGITALVSVGAPSSLSIELARKYDLTLIGFTNGHRFNIYHSPPRSLEN